MSKPVSPRSPPPAGPGRRPDGDDGEQSEAKKIKREHVSFAASDEHADDHGEHQRGNYGQHLWLGTSFTPLNGHGGDSYNDGLGVNDSAERALDEALGVGQNFDYEFGHFVHVDEPVGFAASATSPTSPNSNSLSASAFSSSQASSGQQQQQQAPIAQQYQQQQAQIKQQCQQQAPIQQQQLQYHQHDQHGFESLFELELESPFGQQQQQLHLPAQLSTQQPAQEPSPQPQLHLLAQLPAQEPVQQPLQQPLQQPTPLQQQDDAHPPTGAQVVTAAYGDAVRIDSVLCKRLAAEAALREPVQRRAHQKINTARRSNVEAVLAYVTGQVAARPCKNCQRGHGPWTQCVIYDGQMCGSCSNCWFNASGSRCTFHENNNPQPPQQMNLPQQPRPATPQQPGPAALQQPGPAALQQPGPAALQQPGPAAPQQPGPAAPQQPGPTTPQKPGPATPQLASPDEPQLASPDEPQLLRSDSSPPSEPGPTTPQHPGPVSLQRPGPAALQRPGPAAPKLASPYQPQLLRLDSSPPSKPSPDTPSPYHPLLLRSKISPASAAPAAPRTVSDGNYIARKFMDMVDFGRGTRGSRRLRLMAKIEAAVLEVGVRVAEYDAYVSSPEGIAEIAEEDERRKQDNDNDAGSVGQHER
ncbi:hypothetical protein G6O67_002180 [Ophiocordyceps sinensis]|uniref:Uncharacterized protein n=1 Tax=Ophiocordyceps sinensis TaxID=72228 RepID=A0A8H4PTM8_9HYPO|nr:hypothetical protein G6O67_002180 [Ophiocordyceps sinensis]